MNKKHRKLILNTETLRNLAATDLTQAAGGASTHLCTDCTAICTFCTAPCTNCTHACTICCA